MNKGVQNIPEGTRLILVSDEVWNFWNARTDDGRKIVTQWGDIRLEGWYEPILTIVEDGFVDRIKQDERDRIVNIIETMPVEEIDFADIGGFQALDKEELLARMGVPPGHDTL